MPAIPDPPFDSTELEKFLQPYPVEIRQLALDARSRLHQIAGPASDLSFDATTAVCAGLGYTRNPRDCFVNIAVYPRHVTLVFSWGVHLDDPEGRLKGAGKQIRHLRLDGMQTLHDPYIVDLIGQAAVRAKRPEEPMDPIQVIKVYAGPKRR